MSRAFVKELDGDAPDDGLPEKAQSAHPNYVTAAGLAELKRQLAEALASTSTSPLVARDIKYLRHRIADAIVVESSAGEEIAIGSTVIVDDGEQRRTFTIVGEDEADPVAGLISWTSPLGRALVGAKLNDRVVWERPVGDITVSIVDVRADRNRPSAL